jgi:hypothetical protein
MAGGRGEDWILAVILCTPIRKTRTKEFGLVEFKF